MSADRSSSYRLAWIARHCIKVSNTSGPAAALPISVYYCP
jgi:hypothetical protein